MTVFVSREAGRVERTSPTAQYLIYAAVFFQSLSMENLFSTGSAVDFATAEASPMVQAVTLSLFCWSLFEAYFAKSSLRRIAISLLPFLPLLIWAILSISWSSFPELTLRRSVRLGIEIVTFVLAANALRDEDNILRVLFNAFLVVVVVDLFSFFIPSVAFRDSAGSFAGFHHHKNIAGLFFAISIPVFGLGVINRSISGYRIIALFALLASLGMFAITGAKTAIGVLFLAALLTAITYINDMKRNPYAVVSLTICMCALACVFIVVANLGVPETFDFVFGDASLTGRDQLWNYTLYRFHQSSPLFGVGYGALWQNGEFVKRSLEEAGVDYVVNEAHNGYLDILAQLGYVGLGCLIFFFVVSFRRNMRLMRCDAASRNRLLASLYAMYIFYGSLIFGVTESFLFVGGGILWILQIFLVAYTLFLPGSKFRETV